ncbi:MAG: polyphosphate kinase 1 [Flavobacteriales bacterium]|nr:polyphosphate kinase 1 [Flavobacteriales bacterium]
MAKATSEFINREISWLSFNERVLQEAQDKNNPLIERVRFLGIFSNNLDEFFRVRVATLRRMVDFNKRTRTDLLFDPAQTLKEIRSKVGDLQSAYNETFAEIENQLEAENILFVNHEELSVTQRAFAESYFRHKVRPNLVPIMLGGGNPFPELADDSIYLAVKMTIGKKDAVKNKYALIEVPSYLPRFLVLPTVEGKSYVMWLDDVIRLKLMRLFSIFNPQEITAYTIKITRDAELDIDDDIDKSLVEKMEKSLDRRKKGDYVRFLYDERMPDDLLNYLQRKMKVKAKENIIPGGIYHNRKDLMSFPNFGRDDLVYRPFPPRPHADLVNKTSLITEIRKRDILLHYPYQRFTHFVDLLREAAIDPNVKAIKLNIYRVSNNSQVINALINAARNGKRVDVIIELQARFDEKHNIKVSEQLQDAGARVTFGVPGLKVHSKLALITRREGRKDVHYAHVGTGNFHGKTALIYGDTSLLTADQRIAGEVAKVFDFFENNYQRVTYRHLVVSPYSTRRKFVDLINKEIKNAKEGKKAWITIKLNNLVDARMIRKLYDASNAGVKVRLIIRGICSLIPGVKGMSENIQVTSIVGRFLEHSRVMVFCNNGQALYYISSADWMTRNLDHRIEVSTPIYDPRLQSELTEYLNMQFKDNVKSRIIDKNQRNKYVTAGRKKEEFNSQIETYKYFRKRAGK